MQKTGGISLLLASFLLSCQISCQGTPPVKPDHEELNQYQEKSLSKELTKNLVDKFGRVSDKGIEKKLHDVSGILIESNPELKSLFPTGVEINILNTKAPFCVPGLSNTLYISRGALESFDYENEMAYVLAVSMVMIKDGIPASQLEKMQKENTTQLQVIPTLAATTILDFFRSGWFEPDGFFDYGAAEYIKADTQALRVPYAARYDHNGARTIYKKWATAEVKGFWNILPEPGERYENVKNEVGKLAPLRNSILKGKDFEAFKMKVMGHDVTKKSGKK